MKLDYARVSTEDQIRQLHRARLTVAGCEKVCEEKITGTARKRPELEKLLSEVSPSSGSERRTAYAMRASAACGSAGQRKCSLIHSSSPSDSSKVDPLARSHGCSMCIRRRFIGFGTIKRRISSWPCDKEPVRCGR